MTMDLFNEAFDAALNLLPYDGHVNYFGHIMSDAHADHCFDELHRNIAWQHDQARIAGKRITTDRKVAWYGDAAFAYTYSGTTKHAQPWTDTLLSLKQHVERITHTSFNSCLLNLYANGQQGMAWHGTATMKHRSATTPALPHSASVHNAHLLSNTKPPPKLSQ